MEMSNADTLERIPRCAFCGKANYGSQGAARRGMRTLQKRQPKERLHVYFCREGRTFHVGARADTVNGAAKNTTGLRAGSERQAQERQVVVRCTS